MIPQKECLWVLKQKSKKKDNSEIFQCSLLWQYMAKAGAWARVKIRDKGGAGAENK